MTPTFFYLRHADERRPIGVLALRTNGTPGSVTLAASLCSPADVWDRVAGINKAVGKLASTCHAVNVDMPDDNGTPVVHPSLASDVLNDLLISDTRPAKRLSVLDAFSRIDMPRAQAMLEKQITRLLTPKP